MRHYFQLVCGILCKLFEVLVGGDGTSRILLKFFMSFRKKCINMILGLLSLTISSLIGEFCFHYCFFASDINTVCLKVWKQLIIISEMTMEDQVKMILVSFFKIFSHFFTPIFVFLYHFWLISCFIGCLFLLYFYINFILFY